LLGWLVLTLGRLHCSRRRPLRHQAVADGVYAPSPSPAYKVNCNAAIILFDDSVLVVDTHSKPSASAGAHRADQKLTDKPVRYVVNTHFHWTTTRASGLSEFLARGREIISSEATRLDIERAASRA